MFLIRVLKILIAICQVITVAIACNSDNEICDSLQNDEEIILLSTLEDDWKKEDKIFFIETSGEHEWSIVITNFTQSVRQPVRPSQNFKIKR